MDEDEKGVGSSRLVTLGADKVQEELRELISYV